MDPMRLTFSFFPACCRGELHQQGRIAANAGWVLLRIGPAVWLAPSLQTASALRVWSSWHRRIIPKEL